MFTSVYLNWTKKVCKRETIIEPKSEFTTKKLNISLLNKLFDSTEGPARDGLVMRIIHGIPNLSGRRPCQRISRMNMTENMIIQIRRYNPLHCPEITPEGRGGIGLSNERPQTDHVIWWPMRGLTKIALEGDNIEDTYKIRTSRILERIGLRAVSLKITIIDYLNIYTILWAC